MVHKRVLFLVLFLIFGSCQANAARIFNEAYYQNEWCGRWNGSAEVELSDKTRVDCVTKNYAAEFDFAPKWAEAIGQSLHYSRMTGKKPAIILIIEKPSDFKYYDRTKPLADKYGIKLWYMKGVFYHTNGRALVDFIKRYEVK